MENGFKISVLGYLELIKVAIDLIDDSMKIKRKMICEDNNHCFIKLAQLLDQRTEIKKGKEYLISEYWNQCSFYEYEDNWEEWGEIEEFTDSWRYKPDSDPIIVQLKKTEELMKMEKCQDK